MLRKVKIFLYLLSFISIILYSDLELEDGESTEIPSEVYQKVKINNDVAMEPLIYYDYLSTPEDIEEEIRLGEMELIAQLVQAEAGNQNLTGKRYVVDVVLNRVDSKNFPNSVEEVIYQENQFSVIKNGAFDKAGWEISDECFEAVKMEYEERSNYDILFFSRGKSKYMSTNSFKHQDHWFGW